jgi:hypothetical protein
VTIAIRRALAILVVILATLVVILVTEFVYRPAMGTFGASILGAGTGWCLGIIGGHTALQIWTGGSSP